MTDYFKPRKSILISTSRGGGTFLAHCLDSHIMIGCERGEVINPRGVWQRTLGDKIGRFELLNLVLSRPGYEVNCCKLSYREARWVGLEALKIMGVSRVIHLHRENALRVITSSMINNIDNSPRHSWSAVSLNRISVDIDLFLYECRRYMKNIIKMRQYLTDSKLPVLFLTYEQMMEGASEIKKLPPTLSENICMFLDVDQQILRARIRRINPRPLSEIILNWTPLRQKLIKSEFKRWVNL